jgi:hypothetical protein
MSGPFSATTSYSEWKVSNPSTGAGAFCRTYYRLSTWYRSGNRQRHGMAPLPYSMRLGVTDHTEGSNQTCSASGDIYYSTLVDSRWSNLNSLVSNRAAANFVAEAQGVAQASMGETLGEWRDSLGMITSRLEQLAAAARNLRRGSFSGAARALGLTKDQYGRNTKQRLKTFGNQWLELHLGWEPLITDIYNANNVFMRDPFPRKALGRAGSSDSYVNQVANFPTHRASDQVHYRVGYQVRGDIHVKNPNVALAASLGLVNPVSVAWALVPYSFVVDWFVNLSDYLGLYDGLLGCETLNTSYTSLRRSQGVHKDETRTSVNQPWSINTLVAGRGVFVVRTLGLPPSHLTFINSPRFSWQRGLTAVSLLLGYLR